ncbi:MAG TPA: septum formation initiator family protein [Actinomycetota bacterium]
MSARGHVLPRPRLSRRAAGLAAISFVLLLGLVFPLRQYVIQRSEIAGLERQVQRLEEERVTLERRVERLRDPEYLERIARQCLGMVRPGEIAFVAVPEDGQPLPASC